MHRLELGRVDLEPGGVAKLPAVDARLAGEEESTVVCTSPFICAAGYAVLEAFRLRALERHMSLEIHTPQRGYSRPFAVIGTRQAMASNSGSRSATH